MKWSVYSSLIRWRRSWKLIWARAMLKGFILQCPLDPLSGDDSWAVQQGFMPTKDELDEIFTEEYERWHPDIEALHFSEEYHRANPDPEEILDAEIEELRKRLFPMPWASTSH